MNDTPDKQDNQVAIGCPSDLRTRHEVRFVIEGCVEDPKMARESLGLLNKLFEKLHPTVHLHGIRVEFPDNHP